jgi:hypothetical protein
LGFWEFGGGRVWGRVGAREVSLQLGGFQVSRRALEGEQGETKGNQQGEKKKQGECAMYIVICVRVHKRMLETVE